PFLPVIANDVRNEGLLDLVGSSLAAVAVEDQLYELEMVGGCHLSQVFKVGSLSGKDVVPGNRLQRFGGERQVHRVTGLAAEINGKARKNRIHRTDPAKAPAAMHAE